MLTAAENGTGVANNGQNNANPQGGNGTPGNGTDTGANGQNLAGTNGQPGTGTNGQPGTGANGQPNAAQGLQNLLNGNNTNRPGQTPGTATGGTIMSGGIAGVASIAKGISIKTINDQTKYPLWEFYYDPSQDQMRAQTGLQGQGTNGQNGQMGVQSSFGSGNSQSTGGFGSGPNFSSPNSSSQNPSSQNNGQNPGATATSATSSETQTNPPQ